MYMIIYSTKMKSKAEQNQSTMVYSATLLILSISSKSYQLASSQSSQDSHSI